jgi:hypothetical protein
MSCSNPPNNQVTKQCGDMLGFTKGAATESALICGKMRKQNQLQLNFYKSILKREINRDRG